MTRSFDNDRVNPTGIIQAVQAAERKVGEEEKVVDYQLG